MKKVIFLILFIGLFLSLPAEEKVIRLGQHPFYKSKDLQPADLKIIAIEKAGEVKQGFENAGYPELVYAFLEQIQKTDIQTIQLIPGDRLQWMLFKRGKKVEVKKDVVWAGKTAITAYHFTIFREGKLYEFIVPKICGNISLKSVSDVPAPGCALSVSPDEVEAGTPVKINVCQSKNAVKTTVTISNAKNAVIKTLVLTPANCTAEVIIEKPDQYLVSAISENEYGMQSADGCQARFTIKEKASAVQTQPEVIKKPVSHPLNFFFEGGPGLLRGTYTGTFWARAGINFAIVQEKIDLNFAFGGGIPVKGKPWRNYLLGNALINFYFGSAYLGGGIGFSTKERDDRKAGVDLIGQAGWKIFSGDEATGSIFGELRAPVITSDRPFENHHKILFGFRYNFR